MSEAWARQSGDAITIRELRERLGGFGPELEFIADVREEERWLLGADLTAEGYLVLAGTALIEAAAALRARYVLPSPAAREQARQALARVAAAAAEGIQALEREET